MQAGGVSPLHPVAYTQGKVEVDLASVEVLREDGGGEGQHRQQVEVIAEHGDVVVDVDERRDVAQQSGPALLLRNDHHRGLLQLLWPDGLQ